MRVMQNTKNKASKKNTKKKKKIAAPVQYLPDRGGGL